MSQIRNTRNERSESRSRLPFMSGPTSSPCRAISRPRLRSLSSSTCLTAASQPGVGLVSLQLEVAAAYAEGVVGAVHSTCNPAEMAYCTAYPKVLSAPFAGDQNTVMDEPSFFSVTSHRMPLSFSGQSARFWMRSSLVFGIIVLRCDRNPSTRSKQSTGNNVSIF